VGFTGEELLGDILPGEGGFPLPGPRPPWRYSHGPLQGEILEKNQTRLIPGYQPGHCPRPLPGGVGGRRGALRGGGDEGRIWSVILESIH